MTETREDSRILFHFPVGALQWLSGGGYVPQVPVSAPHRSTCDNHPKHQQQQHPIHTHTHTSTSIRSKSTHLRKDIIKSSSLATDIPHQIHPPCLRSSETSPTRLAPPQPPQTASPKPTFLDGRILREPLAIHLHPGSDPDPSRRDQRNLCRPAGPPAQSPRLHAERPLRRALLPVRRPLVGDQLVRDRDTDGEGEGGAVEAKGGKRDGKREGGGGGGR